MIELLRQRRSIRKYEQRAVEKDKIDVLKETALRSPSSRNIDPWEFVFVDDGELIEKLAKCKKHGSAFLAGAPLAVVVLADEAKSDVWVEDCSIASILLQLVSQSLGLGSCWIQVRNRFTAEGQSSDEYIKQLIGAGVDKRIESIIAIGYPDEQREGKGDDELDRSKIVHNRY